MYLIGCFIIGQRLKIDNTTMYELINDAYKPSSPCLCFLFLIRPFTKNTFPRRNRSRWQKVSTVSLDSNNYKCRCHQWVTCVFCHLSFKHLPLYNLFVFHTILILLSKNLIVYIIKIFNKETIPTATSQVLKIDKNYVL